MLRESVVGDAVAAMSTAIVLLCFERAVVWSACQERRYELLGAAHWRPLRPRRGRLL